MPDLDIQRHWKNHQVVTDDMVAELKSNLCLSYDWGLQILSPLQHQRVFGYPIPNGKVAWLKIDLRLPRMDGFLKEYVKSNTVYSLPNGAV